MGVVVTAMISASMLDKGGVSVLASSRAASWASRGTTRNR
jgi:hypothetical protein